MNRDRRASLALISVGVAAIAGCLLVAYALPEGGVLGFIATAFKFVAGVIAINLPMPIWRAISPEKAARWEESGGRPTPLISPILFWLATIVVAWILVVGTDPPVTFGDYAAMIFLWCVVAGGAAFAIGFTRMYVRDRRSAAG